MFDQSLALEWLERNWLVDVLLGAFLGSILTIGLLAIIHKTKKRQTPKERNSKSHVSRPVSETTKWFAGILAALIGGLILYAIENMKRPVMEVNLNFGFSKYWSGTTLGFRTTPPVSSEISGWSKVPEEVFHVRMRNASEVPLFDCRPFASSRPVVNGVPAQESLPFEGQPLNLNPREMREWDDMKMRFYSNANQYQITIICSCSYYDLFNIKRERKYVETGVVNYIRPTLQSLLMGINELVDDKTAAGTLKAKVEKAQGANADDQVKILTDLQKDFREMGGFYEHTLGVDVDTLLADAQLRQMAKHQPH
jgi:hypothetical protein